MKRLRKAVMQLRAYLAGSRRRAILTITLGLAALLLVVLLPFAHIVRNARDGWIFVGVGREFLELKRLTYPDPLPITIGSSTSFSLLQYSSFNEAPDCEYAHEHDLTVFDVELGLWHCDSPVLNLPAPPDLDP